MASRLLLSAFELLGEVEAEIAAKRKRAKARAAKVAKKAEAAEEAKP